MVRRPPSPDCPPSGRAVGVRHRHAVGAGVLVRGPNTCPLAYSGTILEGERYCYWLKPPRRTTTPTRTL